MQRSNVGVFISYSHIDRLIANVFDNKVREMGYLPWIDFAGIRGGDEWRKSIDRALRQSSAVLVLMTPEAVKSQWVEYEVTCARSYHHTIIPLMIRPCDMPPFLEALQYIDFHHSMDQGFRQLQPALLQAVISHSDQRAEDSEIFGSREVMLRLAQERYKDQSKDKYKTAEDEALRIEGSIKPLALVIEDTEGTQELLRDVLLEEGLDVHIAATRNEAMAYVRKNIYDFITLDMNLGPGDILGQEGYALLEFLREHQINVPIVMITSLEWSKRQYHDFYVEYGVKVVLGKPIVKRELSALIRRYVPDTKKAN
ncbi:MAG: TIR domain-containing protein [Chitinophagaceae bacterium]|nr:TIR domain-containing protein [Anaerolineae bacterium]